MRLNKPLVQCNEADLLALIPGELEGKTLDYKRDQVGKTESDQKEFFYDASSFANALGGHLIFGMDEKDGAPIKLVGLQGINVDDEILRLEQMMRDGIDQFLQRSVKSASTRVTAKSASARARLRRVI
jgi:predicted HTH transcriptional regulator